MTALFLRLFNISVTAGWIVLAVVTVRMLFRKMPRWAVCLLWGIVALRLLLPVTLESGFSLLPSPELIPQNIAVSEAPAIYSGIPAVNRAVNPLLVTVTAQKTHSLEQILHWCAWIWLAGMVLILLYGLLSYIKLCRQVRISVPKEGNVYLCDEIQTPFLLGLLRPRIFIPSGLDEGMLTHILAHEQAHIKRRDHWWKPLGFLLLCVYWFNPLLWAGYILLCRDIESACDEKVIAQKDNLFRVTYMEALVACSVHRRMILACPVAFGEVSVKTRIKGIVRYKKPTVLVLLTSVLTCVLVSLCFLTSPEACAHDYTREITLQATCTEHGLQTNTCRLCSHTYMQTVACAAHTYGEGEVIREATCSETGIRILTCRDCGHKIKGQIPLSNHTPGQLTCIKEPNCIESGALSTECTRCRAQYIVQEPAPNGVHQTEQTVVKAATCTEAGEATDTCIRCAYTQKVTLKAFGHAYKTVKHEPQTCVTGGEKVAACAHCGDTRRTLLSPDGKTHSNNADGHPYCLYCDEYIGEEDTQPWENTYTGTTIDRIQNLPPIRWDYG